MSEDTRPRAIIYEEEWDSYREKITRLMRELEHKDGAIARIETAIKAKRSRREMWTTIAVAVISSATTMIVALLI